MTTETSAKLGNAIPMSSIAELQFALMILDGKVSAIWRQLSELERQYERLRKASIGNGVCP